VDISACVCVSAKTKTHARDGLSLSLSLSLSFSLRGAAEEEHLGVQIVLKGHLTSVAPQPRYEINDELTRLGC
jgi:hypothetical protein